jgi:hypothetical protein
MRKFATVAKFIVALLIPIAQTIQAAVTDDVITPNEWVKIAIAVVGAVGVWAIPNTQPPRSRQELAERLPPPTRAAKPEERPRHRLPYDAP